MEETYQQNSDKTPAGVKVIAIINYIFAVLGILFAAPRGAYVEKNYYSCHYSS